jgi:hypothetical protein
LTRTKSNFTPQYCPIQQSEIGNLAVPSKAVRNFEFLVPVP